ncbi:MAG: STAS domain-containing protein [Thalassotalea sp.]
MGISKKISEDGLVVTIEVAERFDFSLHQAFRESYVQSDKKTSKFVLDLSKTTYMDSSALGMVLLLKDHAESISANVVLYQPSDTVNKILQIAQFHRLFSIES